MGEVRVWPKICHRKIGELTLHEQSQLTLIVKQNYPDCKEQAGDFEEVLEEKQGEVTYLETNSEIEAFFYTENLGKAGVQFRFVNVKKDSQRNGLGQKLIELMAQKIETTRIIGCVVVGNAIGEQYVDAGCVINGIEEIEEGVTVFNLVGSREMNSLFTTKMWGIREFVKTFDRQKKEVTRFLLEENEQVIVREYSRKKEAIQETRELLKRGYFGTIYIVDSEEEMIICFEKI
ncbi:MAG: hypothetical protein L3J07_03780 [Candidatus Magasanikbacteria bacterium]|nr:hypothetical protein [Candidatus Magasanikbacteria bacterium]